MITFGSKHTNTCQQCKREKDDCCEMTSDKSDKKYILCKSCTLFFNYYLNHPNVKGKKNK
jgi:hypothetical protein